MRRAAVILLLTSACLRDDIVAELPSSVSTDGSVDPNRDAGTPPTGYCEGSGPPILVGDGTARECGGNVAQRTFRFGLCVCEDVAAAHAITTDAYDSRQGPYTVGSMGGSIGVNGRVAANASLTVGGTLIAGDTLGVQTGGAPLNVARRFFDDGPLAADGDVQVGGDAFVGGPVRASNLTIGGTLTVPDANAIDVSGASSIGRTVEAPVSVAPPCDCQNELVDIAAYVERHRTDNDNAMIDLDPEALGNVDQATRLTLPCGRYYQRRISGNGDLTLALDGRVALFVGENLAPGASLVVELAPGAELDLFVAGDVVASNRLELGDSSVAAKVRLYVGGSGTLQLDAGAVFGGNLYAPRAELTSAGAVEAFGSLFVRRLAISDRLDVHYDTAVLAAGDDCPEPLPTGCTSCLDCGNQACIAGACGACADDGDCCAPLVCNGGACVPEL